MISTAAGLASCGKISFASSFAVFATGRVYDQIRMDVAYSNANVKIFATHGGISVGKDGASHQMIEDLTLMRVLPNMTVLAPSDATQTRRIVELMATTKGPMYARIGRANASVLYKKEDLNDFKIGKGLIVKDGSDVSIIACGTMLDQAIEAQETLLHDGVSARVVDMHTIKPLDERLVIKCARETNAILTVEEHSIIGQLLLALWIGRRKPPALLLVPLGAGHDGLAGGAGPDEVKHERALGVGNAAEIPARQAARTRPGPETRKIGAAISGSRIPFVRDLRRSARSPSATFDTSQLL